MVVAVCGSPGAGKTTVATATARRLRLPFLTGDAFKNGLGLSSASLAQDGSVQFDPDFHISGGPFTLRAGDVMVEVARLLASSQVSFVVEGSVLSPTLLTALRACDARVLAVHVVAREELIGERLRARAVALAAEQTITDLSAAAHQLASKFERGELKRSIFEPPDGVDAVIEVNTSDHQVPGIEPIEAAVLALLHRRRGSCLGAR